MNRFYVVGTDTGVGKTVFSLILMQYFYSKGLNPFYFKPFQTGCASPMDPESDANYIFGLFSNAIIAAFNIFILQVQTLYNVQHLIMVLFSN